MVKALAAVFAEALRNILQRDSTGLSIGYATDEGLSNRSDQEILYGNRPALVIPPCPDHLEVTLWNYRVKERIG